MRRRRSPRGYFSVAVTQRLSTNRWIRRWSIEGIWATNLRFVERVVARVDEGQQADPRRRVRPELRRLQQLLLLLLLLLPRDADETDQQDGGELHLRTNENSSSVSLDRQGFIRRARWACGPFFGRPMGLVVLERWAVESLYSSEVGFKKNHPRSFLPSPPLSWRVTSLQQPRLYGRRTLFCRVIIER